MRDRIVVFGGNAWVCAACFVTYNDTRSLTWGEAAAPEVGCPDVRPAYPGAITPLEYTIRNPFASSQEFVWSLESGRGWPGFPATGEVVIGGLATQEVTVRVTVPDSAAPGQPVLRLSAALSSGGSAGTCEHPVNVCARAGLEFTPRVLSLRSNGRWVTAHLTLEAPYLASQVDLSSIRLNDAVPLDPERPAEIDRGDRRPAITGSSSPTWRVRRPAPWRT